mmetsp:Transcript_14543/g.41440  ORF Transcript_14543/g.41440 Transcript_14543/m.41440 type:complete len:366 (-) Transcript_14543:939-2036(-)
MARTPSRADGSEGEGEGEGRKDATETLEECGRHERRGHDVRGAAGDGVWNRQGAPWEGRAGKLLRLQPDPSSVRPAGFDAWWVSLQSPSDPGEPPGAEEGEQEEAEAVGGSAALGVGVKTGGVPRGGGGEEGGVLQAEPRGSILVEAFELCPKGLDGRARDEQGRSDQGREREGFGHAVFLAALEDARGREEGGEAFHAVPLPGLREEAQDEGPLSGPLHQGPRGSKEVHRPGKSKNAPVSRKPRLRLTSLFCRFRACLSLLAGAARPAHEQGHPRGDQAHGDCDEEENVRGSRQAGRSVRGREGHAKGRAGSPEGGNRLCGARQERRVEQALLGWHRERARGSQGAERKLGEQVWPEVQQLVVQ